MKILIKVIKNGQQVNDTTLKLISNNLFQNNDKEKRKKFFKYL